MKRLSDQTLYEIIEVPVDATAEEIERACQRAAGTYGPGSLATYTLASAEETALLCSRIDEARAVLLDPGARSRYDERLGIRPASAPLDPEPDHQPPAAGPPPPASWPPPAPEPPDPRPVSPGLPVPAPPLAAPPLPAPILLTVRVEPEIPMAGPVTPILLDREAAPPPAWTAPVGSPWTGELLRRVRESRGLTVQQLAERTRVTRHHLENIEQDRFTALPAPVYLRGILVNLARELRLDGQAVARSYLDRMEPGQVR